MLALLLTASIPAYFGGVARTPSSARTTCAARMVLNDLGDTLEELELQRSLSSQHFACSSTATCYTITARFPGVAAKDLRVSLDDRILTVTGETVVYEKDLKVITTVDRTMPLPRDAIVDGRLSTACEDGRAIVTLPKSSRAIVTAAASRSRNAAAAASRSTAGWQHRAWKQHEWQPISWQRLEDTEEEDDGRTAGALGAAAASAAAAPPPRLVRWLRRLREGQRRTSGEGAPSDGVSAAEAAVNKSNRPPLITFGHVAAGHSNAAAGADGIDRRAQPETAAPPSNMHFFVDPMYGAYVLERFD